MIRTRHLITGLAAVAVTATLAVAGGHGGNPAVKARKAQMQLYSFHLGTLGAMAKGEVEFNADVAQAAADSLAALGAMNTMSMWLPGTSTEELGDETRALPAMWAADSMVGDKAGDFAMAAAAMAEAAGTLDGVRGAIGAVGASCGGCHKPYRGPAN